MTSQLLIVPLLACLPGCTLVNLPRDPGAHQQADTSVYPMSGEMGREEWLVRRAPSAIEGSLPQPAAAELDRGTDDRPWDALRDWAEETTDENAAWAGVRKWVREQFR